MYKLIQDEKIINEYSTRQEANYYKRKHKNSKIVTDYEISDIEKGLFSDNTIIEAESPLQAIKQYIKQNNLNILVKVDLTNTGRFVVRNNNTSKVYSVI